MSHVPAESRLHGSAGFKLSILGESATFFFFFFFFPRCKCGNISSGYGCSTFEDEAFHVIDPLCWAATRCFETEGAVPVVRVIHNIGRVQDACVRHGMAYSAAVYLSE